MFLRKKIYHFNIMEMHVVWQISHINLSYPNGFGYS